MIVTNNLGIETINILVGDEVLTQIRDDKFKSEWDSLYNLCPWATVFQKKEFVTSWYKVYKDRYVPIIVKATKNGQLTGLLTLAKSSDKQIIGAGGNQAEYQVWLADEANNSVFIINAIALLRKQFSKASITLKYIPHATPIKWITKDKFMNGQYIVRTYKQPLLIIDEADINRELSKKNRREKLNRLKRLGELKFERIIELDEFAEILEELATQFDFRKGATVNINPFKDDPLKKTFMLTLFEHNLLHATILKLNKEIIAANIGAWGGNWVHLQGLNTHSPFYAKHSPGIIQFLMLGKLMVEENLEVFDLTPGGDSYKEGLANHYEHVYELTLGSTSNVTIKKIQYKVSNYIKQTLLKAGAKKATFKDFKKTAWIISKRTSQILKSPVANHIIYKFQTNKETTYKADGNTLIRPHNSALIINNNSLADLLCYDGRGAWLTRWEFLEGAMRRFESGERSYTWSEGGRLLACAWLGPVGAAESAGTAGLWGIYCHPDGRGRLASFLAAVAGEACRDGGRVYAAAREAHICQALEAVGFVIIK